MTTVLEQYECSLPSFVVLPALLVQVVQGVSKLAIGWIRKVSHVCDAEAVEAIAELFTVVAERFKVLELLEVFQLPQL